MKHEHSFPIKFRSPDVIIAEHRHLRNGFKFVLANNGSQYAPYHNTWHLMCMVKYVDWLVRSERDKDVWHGDDMDEMALLLAALFHDVNHTMGKSADDVNVQNSKYAFDEFLSTTDDDDVREEWLRTRVRALIDATQFPYVLPAAGLSHDQKIMRDADFMQAYEDNMFFHIVLGIGKEAGKLVLPELKRNIQFHKDVVMNTESGREYREVALPSLIAEFERYIQLLEHE